MNKKKTYTIIAIVLFVILFVVYVVFYSPGSQLRMERHIRNEFSKLELPSFLELKYSADFGDVVLDTKKNWGVGYSYSSSKESYSRQQLYDEIASIMTNNGYTVDKEDGWLLYAKNEEVWMKIYVGENTVGFDVYEY